MDLNHDSKYLGNKINTVSGYVVSLGFLAEVNTKSVWQDSFKIILTERRGEKKDKDELTIKTEKVKQCIKSVSILFLSLHLCPLFWYFNKFILLTLKQ